MKKQNNLDQSMQLDYDLQLKRHLKAWTKYEEVRRRGLFNMLDERRVTAHAAISSYEYHFILTHYEELRDLYNKTIAEDRTPINKEPKKPFRHISLEDQIEFLNYQIKECRIPRDKSFYEAILNTLKRLPKGAD